jgi:hypothetical protein
MPNQVVLPSDGRGFPLTGPVADGLAGEPDPVTDFDRDRESCQGSTPLRHPSRRSSGVNIPSAALHSLNAVDDA